MKKKLLMVTLALSVIFMFSINAMAAEDSQDPAFSDLPQMQELLTQLVNETDTTQATDVEVSANQFIVTLSGFNDIQNHWAKEYIDFTVKEKLFDGTSATTFSPNVNMTRAMFVTVLGRFCNVDTNTYGGTSFSDVPTGTWYSSYVEWAAQNGVTDGYPDGTFRPGETINREQMATLILRFCALAQIDISQISDYYTFNDEAAIANYARDGVDYAKFTGLMTGKSNNMFQPKAGATRAEVATVMTRLVKASRGERIYINYNMAAVPTYSSVVLRPCIGTQYSDNNLAVGTYDQNGAGFFYEYVPGELAVYQNYLVSQGFILADSHTTGDIAVFIYTKGNSIAMGIGVSYSDSFVAIYPNAYAVTN